jgi:hypothetical protein
MLAILPNHQRRELLQKLCKRLASIWSFHRPLFGPSLDPGGDTGIKPARVAQAVDGRYQFLVS